MNGQPAPGARVGKILILSAAIMVALAAAFWLGLFPVTAPARQIVAGALLLAAIADAFMGLRMLGEN